MLKQIQHDRLKETIATNRLYVKTIYKEQLFDKRQGEPQGKFEIHLVAYNSHYTLFKNFH